MVDGAADSAQAVVAVCQHIGKRKRLHTASTGRLNDADIGDIVRGHGIETDAKLLWIARAVMRLQNVVGNGARFILHGSVRSGAAANEGDGRWM